MAKIYITNKEYKADIKVCEVSEYKSEMKFWITDKEHEAKSSDCKWFYVDKEHKADKKICYVKEYKADLKIFEVKKENKAKGRF